MTIDPPAKADDHRHHPHHGPVKTYTLKSQLEQAGAGAASSMVTRFVCQPFEVLKIRFQLQVEPLIDHSDHHQSKYRSFMQGVRLIYKEEGLTALWKGHNAGQVLSVVYGIAQFWSYEQIALRLKQTDLFENQTAITRFVSGGTSGAIATVVSMPFDVIRTRLVSQDTGSGYRNATAAIPSILRAEGIGGLYRGLGTSLIQIGPLVGTSFAFYGLLNDLSMKLLQVRSQQELPTWCILITGGISGTLSKMSVYPLDFIKRRLQVQGFHEHRQTFGKNMTCDGIISCVHITLREEGPLGFYKGLAPTLLKAGISTALYFSVYEKVKHFMQARQ